MNYMFKDNKLHWFDLDNILNTRCYSVDDLLREFDKLVIDKPSTICTIPFKVQITASVWCVHYYVRFDNVYYTGIQEVNIYSEELQEDLVSSLVDLQTKNMLIRQITEEVYNG